MILTICHVMVRTIRLASFVYLKATIFPTLKLAIFSSCPFTSNEIPQVPIPGDSRLLGHIYGHPSHRWGTVDWFHYRGDCCGGRIWICSTLDYKLQQYHDFVVWEALSMDLQGIWNSNLSTGRTSGGTKYDSSIHSLIFRSCGYSKPNDRNVSSWLSRPRGESNRQRNALLRLPVTRLLRPLSGIYPNHEPNHHIWGIAHAYA